jgi:hypothetical protein
VVPFTPSKTRAGGDADAILRIPAQVGYLDDRHVAFAAPDEVVEGTDGLFRAVAAEAKRVAEDEGNGEKAVAGSELI